MTRSRRAALAALAVASLGLALGPAGAAAAPAWLAPDTLTPAGSGSGLAPEVALAAGGGGVAVWQERTAAGTGQPCALVCTGGLTWRMRAAIRAASGSWSAPETLAEGTLADPATPADAPPGPQLAVDPSGAAVAVWRDSSAGLGTVRAAVRPAGGPWGQAENVSGLGLFYGAPSVVADGNGNALAVWAEEEGGDYLVHAALRPSGGAWGLPEPLSAPGADVLGARAAFDGAGNAMVVWARSDGLNERAQAVIRPAGGAWGLPETISPAGRSVVGGLHIDFRADGGAVAAWGSAGTIEAVLRPPGGPWGEAETVAPAAGAAVSLSPSRVALAPDGTAIVVWQRSHIQVLEDISDHSVWAAVRPPAGPWGAGERLSPEGPGGGADADLVVDEAGNAVAAWNASVGSFSRIQASARPVGGAWGAPEALSVARPDAQDVDLDVDAVRNVIAVWQQGRGIAPEDPVRIKAAIRLADALSGAVPGAPRCKPLPAPPEPAGEGDAGQVALSAGQLRINQRISQAGIRRLNAVIAWLDAGIQGRDLCGGAFGSAELASAVLTRRAATPAPEPRLPDPRPIVVAEPGQGGGTPTLSARQLLINQRISQAVVRRANAVEARLDGKLTGGDLAAGALGQAELAPLVRVMEAGASPDPSPSRTVIAPRRPGPAAAVRLTAGQLRINQRISQAGVRRANALIARLEAGLTGEAFANGTITARNLGPELTAP